MYNIFYVCQAHAHRLPATTTAKEVATDIGEIAYADMVCRYNTLTTS